MPSVRSGHVSGHSLFLASYVCCSVLILALVSSGRFLHWFLVPLWMCGVLVTADALDWFRGRLDAFDPVGIMGLLGIHFFFLAPLVHVYSDHWMSTPSPPADWREWLGGMAILNFVGLFVYRWSRNQAQRVSRRPSVTTEWVFDPRRFLGLFPLALLLTGFLQIEIYYQMGGLLGYMSDLAGPDAFEGMGWMFMISESFPVLALIGVVVYARRRKQAWSWTLILGLLLAYLSLKLLFGGLRGSRSNTIWGLFWAVGIVHFWIREVPKKTILVGIAFLVSFMYFYGFYKALGVEAFEALQTTEDVGGLAAETGRTLEVTILSDLARSDVQAFLLYQLSTYPDDYEFAKGRTYLGAAALLIPRSWWPSRPPTKVKEGTEAQYGTGAFVPGRLQSSRVYGLAGEAMLNFGAIGIPFVFGILGMLVGAVRNMLTRLRAEDARFLLYPLLINLCFVVLVSDSDNVVFFILKNGALPFLLVAATTRRHQLRVSSGDTATC